MTTGYPTREQAEAAWAELAGRIDTELPKLTDTASMERAPSPGTLTVLGSGIGVMGFTRDAEQYIDDADHVLFCVADPVTQVWLRSRRADAIDLFALYDDRKPRYHTYMQMTEAMLCAVRQGKRVAAVFYGHPGIFVLSTHRAIAIARREGHRAQMRPGVSALDWLCADLGIDPAYPGMQTFEATDMLLRRRAIDTGSHVVLWQVGLIAEMGFRRRGFHNQHFAHLVDYLAGYYPAGHAVTHYIASRYPTLPPTIEKYKIADLLDPAVHAKITGISTFYIAPAHARSVDMDFAREVGLIRPGQRVGRPRLSRPLDRYGPREIRAIAEMGKFRLPPDYHFQADTAAARFLLALSEQPALRRRFEADPVEAMRDFPDLTAQERKLLGSGRTARVQRAARGASVSLTPGEQFVVDLETQPALNKLWMQMLNTAVKASPKNFQPVNDWLSQHYQGLQLSDLSDAFTSVKAWLLLMWNGIYATGSAQPDVLMVMSGAPPASGSSTVGNGTVYLNASPLYGVTFSSGQLSFSQGGGNPCHGVLTFTGATATTAQTVSGMIWTDAAGKPASNNFTATLQPLPENPLSVWTGEYTTTYTQSTQPGPAIAVYLPSTTNPAPTLYINGQAIANTSFANSTITWSGGTLTFALNPNTPGAMTLSGTYNGQALTGASVPDASLSFEGQYATQHLVSIRGNNVWQPFYPLGLASADGKWTVTLGSQSFTATYADRELTWSDGPAAMQNGDLYFTVNPFTSVPYFVGVVWANGATRPTSANFQGLASGNALLNFTGSYPSTVNGQPGEVLTINGSGSSSNLQVTYGSDPVNFTFYTGRLSGTTSKGLQLAATFKYVTAGSTQPPTYAPAFTGTQISGTTTSAWASTTISNDVQQWIGTYDTALVSETNGSSVPGGPTLTIAATDATNYTVSITAGGMTSTITATYQQTGNALYWSGQDVQGDSRFNSGAISFYRDNLAGTSGFKGAFFGTGPAPKSPNWSGTLSTNGGGGGGGVPGWVWIVVGGVVVGVVGIAALARWFSAGRSGYTRAATDDSIEMDKEKCE